jgi:hypothetical protein
MTPQESQSAGRSKTIKATLVCIAIPLLILLFQETKGDFANGILFYMAYVFTPFSFTILAIILGLTFLFGGKAGKEIIIGKKNFIIISIKYVLLISIAVYACIIINGKITFPEDRPHDTGYFLKYFLLPATLTSVKILTILLVAWLYATFRLKMMLHKNKTS